MRRGHSGIGGWRNEAPRHFRPRGGLPPQYGHPPPYSLLDHPHKFGGHRLPGPRLHRGTSHYNAHSGPRHNHYTFRPHGNQPRHVDRDDRDHDRHNYQPTHVRSSDVVDHSPSYKTILTHCQNVALGKVEHTHINSMGDIDHRQSFNPMDNAKPFNQNLIRPWNKSIDHRRTSYDDRSLHTRHNRYHDNIEVNSIPTLTSHRPPSSDHYEGNIPSAVDNSNSFSRSVDDTVDIVRKRLMNRSESLSNSDIQQPEQTPDSSTAVAVPTSTYQDEPPTPPTTKKRIQRRRQNVKSNCDKIKNKIVHQLFKMDKEKIHKLMDNPNSSSKFEYAISSLITESQNSLDRHLRSVAEKSLCSSSTEFIHDDNNTIYEDTFLKQMQCILEPQDTVLLEDIKPLVMAELNKVLQLDEFDQRFDMGDEDPQYYPAEEQSNNISYPIDFDYKDYNKRSPIANFREDSGAVDYYPMQEFSQSNISVEDAPESSDQFTQMPPLYERRARTVNRDVNQFTRESTEDLGQVRRSMDRERNNFSEERRFRCESPARSPAPLFDSNVQQMSDDEDPFADLDKQYHVVVDRNFIEAELDKHLMSTTENSMSETESTTKAQLIDSTKEKSPVVKKEVLRSPELNPIVVKKEIDNQLLSLAKSPLKLSSSVNKVQSSKIDNSQNTPVKGEAVDTREPGINYDTFTENENHDTSTENVSQSQNPELKDTQHENQKSKTTDTVTSSVPSNARKRSIDQKPSHRKEKRKKSESSPVEPNKQILNKNIIINVNDCGSKTTEKKCDAAKSIFNLFFSKEDSGKGLSKDVKHVELADKEYSDKYVKRKETPKKKEHESKRNHSSSTSHSTTSPKENNNISKDTQPKVDAKNKLKPIDMFLDHPKKVLSTHQAHRNTAQAASTKKTDDKKPLVEVKSKSAKRHVATQIVIKMQSRETQTFLPKTTVSKPCQTDLKKFATKGIQTSPVTFEKSGIKSTDTFERMKEIDLEIQVLLQEKFKLYNSLEAKESSSSSMQNLGMTVLNVTPIDEPLDEPVVGPTHEPMDEPVVEIESELSEDTIVDDFTSIPVEELEQIALESVEEKPSKPVKVHTKRSKRQKVLEKSRTKSQSPDAADDKDDKAITPNISLIEQIITDDRPLEDIISLDDLESLEEKQVDTTTTATKKKRSQKSSTRATKKKGKKNKAAKPVDNTTKFGLRECSVVLRREDIDNYLNRNVVAKTKSQLKEIVSNPDIEKVTSTRVEKAASPKIEKGPSPKIDKIVVNPKIHKVVVSPKMKKVVVSRKIVKVVVNPKIKKIVVDPKIEKAIVDPKTEKEGVTDEPSASEQPGVSVPDLQFDMLDVSEDIVIGDDCEIKSSEEKDADVTERGDVSISEEIILDNSQSSADDATPSEAGQSENECRLFDYSADETLKRDTITVTGNADAVLAIECIENNFIAACLDGNVYHFSNDGQLLTTLRGSNLAVTCLTIVKEKYGTTVYTGSLDSRIRYYDLETGLEKGPECNVLSPIQTMDRAWDTVFVGTRTGFVLQFECKNNMLIPVSTVKFSEQSILALRALKEGPRKVLLVAARSDNVTIKDAQTGLLLRTLEGPKMTVYTLLYEDGKVYCGTSSHQIHAFDYATGSHWGTHEGGKGCVCLRAAGGLLLAGCYDGCVYVFREGEPRPFAQLRGPSLMLLSLAIVGTKIIAGYKDRSLYIWKIPLSILKEMIL